MAKTKDPEVRFDELDEATVTELVALCHMLGKNHAHVLMDRNRLTDLLLGEPNPEDPVAEVRGNIKAFVERNRLLINKSLLNCNLKCDSCPVTRVVECYTDHKEEVG